MDITEVESLHGFSVGDRVQIVGGAYAGRSGRITRIDADCPDDWNFEVFFDDEPKDGTWVGEWQIVALQEEEPTLQA